jgi:hypothetical protein
MRKLWPTRASPDMKKKRQGAEEYLEVTRRKEQEDNIRLVWIKFESYEEFIECLD